MNAILLAEDESGYRAYDYELDDDSFEIDVYDGKNVKVNYEINLAGDTILDKEQDDMDDDDGKAVRDATVSMVEAVNSQVSGNTVLYEVEIEDIHDKYYWEIKFAQDGNERKTVAVNTQDVNDVIECDSDDCDDD